MSLIMRKPLSVLNDPVSRRSREVAYQMPVNCRWIWEGTMQYTRCCVQSEKFTKGSEISVLKPTRKFGKLASDLRKIEANKAFEWVKFESNWSSPAELHSMSCAKKDWIKKASSQKTQNSVSRGFATSRTKWLPGIRQPPRWWLLCVRAFDPTTQNGLEGLAVLTTIRWIYSWDLDWFTKIHLNV